MKSITRIFFVLVFIVSTFSLTGCNNATKTFSARMGANYKVPILPPSGLLYTYVKAPLTTTFHNTPNEATMKMAHKKTKYFAIPFVDINFAWGNSAIQDIAKEGSIEQVAYADYEYFSFLVFFKSFQVNVYGYGPE